MPRRGNLEGTVTRRADGRWMGRVLVGRERVTVYGASRRECVERLAAVPRRPDESLLAWVAEWLSAVRRGAAESSLHRLEQVVATHFTPHLAGVGLRGLDADGVSAWLDALATAGASAQEQARALKALRQCLRAAVRRERLGVNPAEAVDPPRFERRPAHVLDLDQLARLLAELAPLWRAWLLATIDAALRPGEALGLDWPDYNPAAGTLRVECTYSVVRNRSVLKPLKTAGSRRLVYLGAASRAALDAVRREAGPVFVGLHGCREHRNNLTNRVFHPALERAGLPRVRLYDLRHSSATLLLLAGVDVRTVAARLGHADPSTTLRHYAHTLPGNQKAVARVWDAMLRPADGPQPPG